ncbi:MAG TPA: formylglycine-generating enzyme family protein [Terriglobales bacterium]|nr:formylglycine-generating enzyme family protein [Terriglobales bacterium]
MKLVRFLPAFLFLFALLSALLVHDGVARPRAPAARDTSMVLIPAGEFSMGREGGPDNPAHTVRLAAFRIDRYEVTNAEYAEFCKATKRDLPFFWGMQRFHSGPAFPGHPVVGVSWSDAQAYAKWRGKRLPTEAEWERAARGGIAGAKFVGGDALDSTQVNYALSRRDGTMPVGSYAPNGYGLYDMAGNVQEWVADRYDAEYYRTGPAENPQGPEQGKFRVIRGGGWYTGPGCMGVGYRIGLPSNWVDFNVGFRCARDTEAQADSTGR